MALLHAIKKFFAAPTLVTRLDDLEPGQVVVEGVVRTGAAGTLQSPIKGLPCVAFFYTAGHRVPGRAAQLAERPLKHVEAFQAFELELDGGRLEAVPRVAGGFTREAHQALVNTGYANFHAAEELVPPRARIRLRGVAKRRGDGWVVTYTRIERLQAAPGGKSPNKRKR